jgi:hypothetical protein
MCDYKANPAGAFLPRPLRRCLPTGYPRLGVCAELSGSAQQKKNGDKTLTPAARVPGIPPDLQFTDNLTRYQVVGQGRACSGLPIHVLKGDHKALRRSATFR